MVSLRVLYQKTKDILSEAWRIANLNIEPGDAAFIAICHSVLSFILGLNFILHGEFTMTGPLIFYASLISVPAWGMLIVGAVLLFWAGWASKRAFPVTVSALFNSGIWFGITTCALIGAIAIGAGYLYVAIPLYIMVLWMKFFQLQLKRIRPDGE